MLLLISLSLSIGMIRALDAEISINCGQLVVHGYNACEIQHHDSLINYAGPKKKVYQDLRFGLITYKCDHTSAYLTSEFDCMKCNFKCYNEEATTGSSCRQEDIQFWSGTILGVCSAALVGIFVFKRVYQTFDPNAWFIYNKLTGNRDNTASATSGDMMSDEIILNEEADQQSDHNNRLSSVNRAIDGNNLTATPSVNQKTLLSVAAGFLLCTTVKACDVIVMVSHNETTFCHEFRCSTMNSRTMTPLFTVEVGQEICIEDHLGEKVSLHVSDITARVRYELMYFTAEYVTRGVTAEGVCCDARDCMSEDCYHSAYSLFTYEQTLRNQIIDDACYPSKSSDQHVRCLWFEQREIKGELCGVFEKTGNAGTIKFIVKENDDSRMVVLNSYDEIYHLTGLKLQGIDSIPIFVSGLDTDTMRSLLSCNGTIYQINASLPFSYPTYGDFGDLKISLDGLEERYPDEDYSNHCEVSEHESCACNCSTPQRESMIGQFVRQKSNFNRLNNFIWRENDTVIDTFETTHRFVKMRLGNRSISNYEFQEAKCDVEFLTSYSCTSCNDSAYVVMVARKIHNEGLIPFHSNCSFDRQTIMCDYEPTKIVLKDNHRHCYIRMLTLDKKFVINFRYPNFGYQNESKTEISFLSYGDALGSLVTSGQFVRAFFQAALLFFIFYAVLTIASRTIVRKRWGR